MAADLGFGRGEISTAIGVSNLMIAFATPFFGRLMDKYGVRRPLLISIVLFALATAAMSLLPASIPVLFVLYAIAGLVGVGQNPGAYSLAVSSWFDRNRGLALGITLAGVGLGTAVISAVSGALIASFGWRIGYVGLGIVILLLAFFPVLLLLKTPADVGRHEASVRLRTGLTLSEALREWRFWAMAVAFFLAAFVINGSMIHIVPLLTDRGIPLPEAIATISAAGLALIVGRLIAGYLMDKVHAPLLAIFFLVLPIVGLTLLGKGSGAPLVGAVLLGAGVGAEIDIMSFLIGRYFGMRAFGSLHGGLFTAAVLGNAAGASALGWAFQEFGPYELAFNLCKGLLVIGCVLFAILGRYRYPAEDWAPENATQPDPSVAKA